MAKTKATGSTRLGRKSLPKYLGIKVASGQKIKPGMIIVKQRGSRFVPGRNVRQSHDYTLYATKEGIVRFVSKKKRRFDNSRKLIRVANVEQ